MSTLVATNLKYLIADVVPFRTWTSTADQTAARARVYVAGVDDDALTRPFALVLTEEGVVSRRVAGGAVDVHEEAGTLWVLFEAIASGADEEAIAQSFLGSVGNIVSGIAALAGYGYIRIRSIKQSEPYQRAVDDDGADLCQIAFAVEWGTA